MQRVTASLAIASALIAGTTAQSAPPSAPPGPIRIASCTLTPAGDLTIQFANTSPITALRVDFKIATSTDSQSASGERQTTTTTSMIHDSGAFSKGNKLTARAKGLHGTLSACAVSSAHFLDGTDWP